MPQMVCDKCSWKSKDNDNLMQIDDDAMIHAMLTNFEHTICGISITLYIAFMMIVLWNTK